MNKCYWDKIEEVVNKIVKDCDDDGNNCHESKIQVRELNNTKHVSLFQYTVHIVLSHR